MAHAKELDLLIEEWTAQRSAEEATALLQRAGVAAGPLQNVEDLLLRDEQLRARQHWLALDHPELGKVTAERWGFCLSPASGVFYRCASLLGEHNALVFGEVLGLAEERINELIVEGAIA